MKKKKTEIYKFHSVIYPVQLFITKTFEIDDLMQMFYAKTSNTDVKYITNELDRGPGVSARTVDVVTRKEGIVGELIVLFRPNRINAGVLAHEAVHCLTFMGNYLGFCRTDLNDEPEAYYTQWVVNCAESVLKNCPGKVFKNPHLTLPYTILTPDD